MHYCYIDFETQVTKTLQLRKMTLRNYLRDAAVLGFAAAIDDEPVTWFPAPFAPEVLALLAEIVESPEYTVVAHNAAFDVRVMRHSLNLQQPSHVHCTLELACAAFPNQAGGYSLRNLATTLNLGVEKLDIDFDKHTQEEMEKYCKRDVELCRLIHKLCLPRLCAEEVQMAEMCNTVRELWFDVDGEKVAAAFKDFTDQSAEAAIEAMTFLGEGAAKGFGVSDKELAGKILEGEAGGEAVHDAITAGTTTIKSVKPHVIKELLLDNLGFAAQSISRKKINPEKLRENEKVANVITSVEKANKALSHMRRVRVFNNAAQIDMELGYFRATATGRFSSPQPGGRGINGHNLPKRNKRISKALRSIFRFPDGLVAVRGDFANVEYRCISEGTLIPTDSGWKPIERISSIDRVWDGVSYVHHKGVVCQGRRAVVDVHGVKLTPDHPIWTSKGWVQAERVGTMALHTPDLASDGGRLSVLTPPSGSGYTLLSAAIAGEKPTSPTPTSSETCPVNVGHAPLLDGGVSNRLYLISPANDTGSMFTRGCSPVVSTQRAKAGNTTEHEVSQSILCSMNGTHSSDMWRSISTGDGSTSLSTAQTTTETTHQETYDSPPCPNRTATSVAKVVAVYDLLECGPRHQFQAGGLIVHNCAGLIADCQHIINLFAKDPFNDPYLGFGNEATGVKWTKADPVRNGLFKPAVLGLQYLMSSHRFCEELLRNYADPEQGLKVDDLRRVCADMKWEFAKLPPFAKSIKTRLKCPDEFVCAAHYIRERFHEIHPEFGRTARWIMSLLGDVVRSLAPEKAIDRCYEQPNAPPRAQLDIRFASDKYGRGTKNVEIYLCGWPQPTVVWRDLAMRECIQFGKLGVAITAMHATKGYRPITPNIAIEGPSQSAARIGVVKAHLALRERYPYQYSVHDELMLITEQNPAAVRAAYDALVEVVGPGNKLGFGWAVLVDPSEITVTKSLYEVPVETLLEPIGIDTKGKAMYPKPAVFWDRVRTEPQLLERLP